jgi:molecular chaperone GrpE
MTRKKDELAGANPEAAVPAPDVGGAPEVAVPVPAADDPARAAADELQADIAAVNDRLLRLQADFDNFRKRTARERAEVHVRSLEDLMQELLPVLDHFEMGLASAGRQGTDPAVFQGLALVLDQFRAALTRFGLTPIEAVGKPFDPNHHESVAMMPSEEYSRDTVVTETRRGYVLGGRLLRAAQVVVSAGPAAPAGEEASHA